MKKGWTYKRLGEVCEVINGLWTGKKPPFVNVGVIRNANFTKDFKLDYSNIAYLDVEERQFTKRKLQKGDLIVEKSGGSDKNPVGRAVLFDLEEGDYSFSNFTSVLRIKKEFDLAPHFLYLQILFYYQRGDMAEMQNAAIGIHNIIFDSYLSMPIPLPPLSEQKAIVAKLDVAFAQIEALKEKTARTLEEAKVCFQAALAEAMTPKKGWETKKLGEIATDMYRGAEITRAQITTQGTPCVRYGEIYTTYNTSFIDCISHTDEKLLKSPKYFERGDLLFAITGESVEDIGKCIAYLGHERCLAGSDTVVMKHNQNPKFLSYALSTPDAIRQKGYGKTKLKVVHSSVPSLKEISISFPSPQEQQHIASHLDSLSEQVMQLQYKCNKLNAECEAMKQALLREVFE